MKSGWKTAAGQSSFQSNFANSAETRMIIEHCWLPQGFEPRYADPELMDHVRENLGFHADNSITYLQLKPARKHFDEVLKRLALAHSGSKRTVHLRHSPFVTDEAVCSFRDLLHVLGARRRSSFRLVRFGISRSSSSNVRLF